jgi:hypothetical protein
MFQFEFQSRVDHCFRMFTIWAFYWMKGENYVNVTQSQEEIDNLCLVHKPNIIFVSVANAFNN